jgi:hypothetical protein
MGVMSSDYAPGVFSSSASVGTYSGNYCLNFTREQLDQLMFFEDGEIMLFENGNRMIFDGV